MSQPEVRTRRIGPDGPFIRVADDQPTFWDRVEAGAWEPGTLAAIRRFVAPGIAFFDLGAWVGPLSLYAAALGARVVAVEADPAALDQLQRNLTVNPSLSDRIDVLAAAVSAEDAPVRLGARRKPGDSMSSALLSSASASWLAASVTPARLVAMAGDDETLFVKLDIEGGEYQLLASLAPALRPPSRLLASFHPQILRDSGVSDVTGRTRSALDALAGWKGIRINDDFMDRPVTTGEAMVSAVDAETWLFEAPGST